MKNLVSILIPAYNAQAWIGDTIQSAIAQTWPKKEIVVVDDGSSDNTLEVARKYESSLLKVVHQERSGACRARNLAWQVCQGDYIQWLDADDLLAPDKIELQLTHNDGELDPEVLLSSEWGTFYYRAWKAKFRPTILWQDHDAVEWLVLRLENKGMMAPAAWLSSRQLTAKAGPWDERLQRDQDGEYFCRLVSLCRKVKFVHGSRCYYRIANPHSVSKSRSRESWESQHLCYMLLVHHVLFRENSERTRKACVAQLNTGISELLREAPDLIGSLRERILELGGDIMRPAESRKFLLTRLIIGERNAYRMKEVLWRKYAKLLSIYDQLLAKLFGNG
jgi:glycosyltransferase involved in cell wall biosynthesis